MRYDYEIQMKEKAIFSQDINRRLRAKILKRKRDGPTKQEVFKYLVEKAGLTRPTPTFGWGRRSARGIGPPTRSSRASC